MQSSVFNGIFNMIRKQTFTYKGLAPMFADKSFLTDVFISQANSDSIGFVTLMRQSAEQALGEKIIPHIPTLVLWGEEDKLTKISMEQNLAKMITNAELKIVAGVRHMPQIEKPDEFAKIVSEFLG